MKKKKKKKEWSPREKEDIARGFEHVEELSIKRKIPEEKQEQAHKIEKELASLEKLKDAMPMTTEEVGRAKLLLKNLADKYPEEDLLVGMEKEGLSPEDRDLLLRDYNRIGIEGQISLLRFQALMLAVGGDIEASTGKESVSMRDIIEFFRTIGEELKKREQREETMALPSHSSVMFPLLAIFAGKPGRIPSMLLEKSYKDLTEAERKEYDAFFDSVIHKQSKPTFDEEGLSITKENYIVNILTDSEELRAFATADIPLFSDDRTQDINTAIAIKRKYGPEGLKHLYGFLWALDESIGKDHFVYDENEHLERLGYTRKKNRSFAPKQKEIARGILRIMSEFKITIVKQGKNEKEIVINEQPLFHAGTKSSTIHRGKGIVKQQAVIYADPIWYGSAFENVEGRGAQFTPIYKKVAQVNYTKHPYVGILYGFLSIYWRMNPEGKTLSVGQLLRHCGIKVDKSLGKSLRELEGDLRYMVDEGFLKEWTLSNGESLSGAVKPSKILDERISFIPPDWQREEIERIQAGRGSLPRAKKSLSGPMTREEFLETLERSGLNQKQFAEKIGRSKALVSQIKSGKVETISPKVAEAVRRVFG